MNEVKVIGENTMLRLGLVITVMSAVTAFTWWASGVNSSLNTLLAGQRRDIDNSRVLQGRVETLERASDMFTQVGSAESAQRITPLVPVTKVTVTLSSFVLRSVAVQSKVKTQTPVTLCEIMMPMG